jgi:hypothetical protein
MKLYIMQEIAMLYWLGDAWLKPSTCHGAHCNAQDDMEQIERDASKQAITAE